MRNKDAVSFETVTTVFMAQLKNIAIISIKKGRRDEIQGCDH
jgi:hypothetical protein